MNFVVSGDSNPALFSVAPSIDSNGTLTYTLASGTGAATISVYLDDNGSTANGGVTTSAVQDFTITATPPAAAYDLPLPAGVQVDNAPGMMASVNGITYFVATDSAHGTQIWETDGNLNGTSVVTNLPAGSSIGDLTAFKGALYFSVDSGSGNSASGQLYEISGTTVAAVGPTFESIGSIDSTPSSPNNPTLPTQAGAFFTENGFLYFTEVGSGFPGEVYTTDGTTISGLGQVGDASNFAVVNPAAATPLVVFSGNDGDSGNQLFVTDGTAAGTSMLTDLNTNNDSINGGINPGSPFLGNNLSSLGSQIEASLANQTEIVSLGNFDVFTANMGTSSAPDMQLWKTDGTAAGTSEIMDFGNVSLFSMAGVNGKAIFSTLSGVENGEIWITDGTATGTSPIFPQGSFFGTGVIDLGNVSFNNALYFIGDDTVANTGNGFGLYATDGTTTISLLGSNFVFATDVSAGTTFITPSNISLGAIGNSLFFSANGLGDGTQLWQTYGQYSGVELAKDIVPGTGSDPVNFVSNGQALLFDVSNTTDGGLWTAGNSIQLNDQSYIAPENFAGASALPLTGNLLNGAQDVNGEVLQVTPESNVATANGSVTINADGSFSYTPDAGYLGPDSFSYQVTNTDGMVRTATASLNVEFINQAPSFTVPATTTVLESTSNEAVTVPGFATNISVGSGDPVTETVQFNVLNDDNPALFTVAPSIDASGNLTYTLAANESGTANITVDAQNSGGTANGGNDTSASQIFTIDVGFVNQAPTFTLPADPNALVVENTGAHTATLFATNVADGVGDPAGQTLNFVVSGDSNPALFSVAPSIDSNGTLTYTLASGTGAATISVYLDDNGSTANGGVTTSAVQEFTITATPPAAVYDLPLPAGVQVDNAPGMMASVNGITYFVATDSAHGTQIWETDGNLNGTSVVTNLPAGSSIGDLTAFKGALYFSVDSGSGNSASGQLYEISGTTVAAVGPTFESIGSIDSTPSSPNNPTLPTQAGAFFTENGFLYFTEVGSGFPGEVYTTDGTTISGLGQVGDASNFAVVNPAAATPLVVFSGNDGDSGNQLFVTDGTAAGTSMLTDLNTNNDSINGGINPGSPFLGNNLSSLGSQIEASLANQTEIVSLGNFDVFTANMGTSSAPDMQLWKTDGTAAGTSEIMDFGNVSLFSMAGVNGKAIFSTLSGVENGEIWITDGTATGTSPIFPQGSFFGTGVIDLGNVSFNNALYFIGDDTVANTGNGFGLYATDGTTTTSLLGSNFVFATDVSAGTTFITPSNISLGVIGNSLFFSANGLGDGTQLWQTYGQYSGVELAKDIVPGTGSDPVNFVSNGQALLFDVSNTTDGGLWTAGNSIQLNDQSYVAPENFAGEQALPLTGNLLNGAQDVNGESLSVTSHSTPADGSLTVNPDGSFSYTANAGYLGPDSFSYQVTNTDGTVRTGTVSLNVEFVNQAPSFTEGANQSVPENSGAETVNGFVTNISPGAGDPGNETVSIASVTNDNNALFSVQPAIDTSGNLTYTVSGAVNSPSVETTVTVEAQNSGGTANGGHNTTSETFTITVNDVGPSNISLSNSTVADNASNNTVVGNLSANDPIASNNNYVITADPLGALGVSGNQVVVSNSAHLAGHTSDTITIQDTDLAGESYTKSFTITIQTEPPVANNDAYNDFHLSANAATITESAAQGVLANDTDSNGLALTAQLLTGPSNAKAGSFSFNADGSFSYTGKSGFSGVDSFTYKVSDGLFSSNTATVSINVDIIPVISGVPASATFIEGQAPVILSPSSSATHSTGFTNSDLTVSLTNNGTSTDVLSITTTSTITLSGSNVLYSGTDIGSYSGGTDLNPLVVTFNSSATNTSVAKVMDAIAFSNSSSSPSALSRTVQFQLMDSAGDSSAMSTVVSMVDDVPTIGATSTNLNIVTGTTSHVGSLEWFDPQ